MSATKTGGCRGTRDSASASSGAVVAGAIVAGAIVSDVELGDAAAVVSTVVAGASVHSGREGDDSVGALVTGADDAGTSLVGVGTSLVVVDESLGTHSGSIGSSALAPAAAAPSTHNTVATDIATERFKRELMS